MRDCFILFILVPARLMKIRPKLLEMLNRGGCRILKCKLRIISLFSIPDVQPAHVFEIVPQKQN
jgi:hypothetical protein